MFARRDGRSVDKICSARIIWFKLFETDLHIISSGYKYLAHISVGVLIGECACHRSGCYARKLGSTPKQRVIFEKLSLSNFSVHLADIEHTKI